MKFPVTKKYKVNTISAQLKYQVDEFLKSGLPVCDFKKLGKFPVIEWLVVTEVGRYYFPTRTKARAFKGREKGEIIKVKVVKAKPY